MSKWFKITGMATVAAILLLSAVGTVFAGSNNTVGGLVFIDSNMNGVWDAGEEGYKGEWVEYWEDDELIQRYVGATVTLSPDNGATTYTLESAGYVSLTEDEIADGITDVCTYQDLTTADGEDDDTDPDINASPARPCEGTWGFPQAGESGLVWTVWVTAPEGYVVTSQNPQAYVAGSGNLLNFGIAPVGAGGTSEMTADVSGLALPVTGGIALTVAALALMMTGGTAVVVGSKRKQ